jgi:hypothetical protein
LVEQLIAAEASPEAAAAAALEQVEMAREGVGGALGRWRRAAAAVTWELAVLRALQESSCSSPDLARSPL